MRCFRILPLLLACLLTLTACSKQTAPVQDPSPDALTLFDCGGLQAALPSGYLDLLHIERDAGDCGRSDVFCFPCTRRLPMTTRSRNMGRRAASSLD